MATTVARTAVLKRSSFLLPAVGAAVWLALADRDVVAGLAVAAGAVPWFAVFAVCVALALTWAHFGLAAVAVRAASGLPLPLREATASQLASSALNRILPAGLGGSAVNARYLSRRGLPLGAALTAIGTLGVLGAVADLAATALVVVAGRWVGLGGGPRELHLLATRGMHLTGAARLVGPVVAVLVVATVGTAAIRWVRRRRTRPAGPGSAWRHLAALVRQPRRTSVLMLSSAGTTVVLAVAFAVVVRTIVGGATLPVAALLVAYLVGAAAASAAHVPAIAGSTEIALTGALVASGLPAGPSLAAVLVFRGLTFWAPLPVGLVALRSLRRHGAL
jgi:uncharacterized membrane protein YbhN (UPF0104 family)